MIASGVASSIANSAAFSVPTGQRHDAELGLEGVVGRRRLPDELGLAAPLVPDPAPEPAQRGLRMRIVDRRARTQAVGALADDQRAAVVRTDRQARDRPVEHRSFIASVTLEVA
jgi:hypothetical protein